MAPTYREGKKSNYRLPILIVVAILVIVAIAAMLASIPSHVYTIALHTSISLTQNSSIIYKFQYSPSTFILYLKNSTDSGATFYITKLPILAYPVVSIYLASNSSANISSSGSGPADLHIYLYSSSPKGAEIDLTPIDPQLRIKMSGVTSVMQPTQFSEKMLYTGQVTIISTTSTTTSTTITTTTINQSKVIPLQEIMNFVNTTSPAILMNNFNQLYQRDRVCNASIYNATFQTLEKIPATGPNSFYNVSPSVPRSINFTVSKINNSTYVVDYYGLTPSKAYTGKLLSMKISLTPQPSILNVTFEGIFENMNLTQVTKIYTFQSSIQNFCGAYMPYIPTS